MTTESQLDSDPTEKPPTPYRCPDLGFHFTEEENRLIHLHSRAAAEYMKTYGQGPAQPQIDLTHYINSTSEEQCHQKEDTK